MVRKELRGMTSSVVPRSCLPDGGEYPFRACITRGHMFAALKDLFQTMGTDWRMWLLFLVALCLLIMAVKIVIRVCLWLDRFI